MNALIVTCAFSGARLNRRRTMPIAKHANNIIMLSNRAFLHPPTAQFFGRSERSLKRYGQIGWPCNTSCPEELAFNDDLMRPKQTVPGFRSKADRRDTRLPRQAERDGR